MSIETRYFALRGGLDLVSTPIEIPGGRVIAGQNYEPHPRGYQRIDGFERFDGRPKPSDASYWVLNFDAGSAEVADGDIVIGSTSGATGIAVIAGVLESGTYGGGDAAGYLVLYQVSGVFQDNENLQVSAVTVAQANGSALQRGASADAQDSTWLQAAVEKTRAVIAAVPGSGAVRGVHVYGGNVYAFRDNAGGTAGVMHKATASGWAAVALGQEIAFTDGSGELEVFEVAGAAPDYIPELIRDQQAINNGAVTADVLTQPCMDFDGSVWIDSGTTLPAAGNLFANSAEGSWSVECRFKVDSVTSARAILNRGSGNGVGGNFSLWVDTSGNLQCRIRGGTTTQVAAAVNDGAFHTVAIVYDTASCLAYVDGAAGVTVNVGTAALTTSNHYDNLGIGGRADGGALLHDGQITDVRVWSAARTAAQVAQYRNRRLKGTEEGLEYYWPMSIVQGGFEEGQTLAGGASGATAEILRVATESGDFTTLDAKGRLIIGAVTGGPFQDGESLSATGGTATANGAESAITLPAGGRYDCVNQNFYGASNLKRMYGVNGVGHGFEFDGTVFVPIHTGMETDKPIRVAVHQNHLFYAYDGGSLQHSSAGDPYQWQVLTGASEIGIGEEITGLLSDVSGVLAVFGKKKVAVLVGNDSANWALVVLADDAGGVAWTAQRIGLPIYLDKQGLRSLETTDKFGDFQIGTLTKRVESLFRSKATSGLTPKASLRVRKKDQYRLFWNDGTGVTLYFGRDPIEILPFDLNLSVACTTSGDDDADADFLLLGDDSGMVYQLDAGTSFDGSEVQAFLRLPFTHVGSPAQRKRWTKATVEMDGGPDIKLGVVAEFGYGDPDQPPSQELSFNVRGSGGFWDELSWDDFYWSSPVEGVAEAPIDGLSRNISIVVISDATYERPHVLHGLLLNFSYRGLVR